MTYHLYQHAFRSTNNQAESETGIRKQRKQSQRTRILITSDMTTPSMR